MLYLGFLLLLSAERLLELRISRRNAALALARGGREQGQRHYRFMVVLHSAFLVGCGLEVWLLRRPFQPWPGFGLLALALLAQALRYTAIRSLGPAWNVRVIVVPGQEAVTRGLYRFMRHPNYLAVIVEGVAVPLIHGAVLTALVFSLCNAALLVVRIRCEERALADLRGYRQAMAGLPRFFPGLAGRKEIEQIKKGSSSA